VFVHPRTIVNYFAQHQAEALNPELNVLEETLYGLDHQQEAMARNLLARLLFRGDAVFKSVRVLSGGERSRVALAKFLLRPANLLILDEPTNHLDPAARAVLRGALSRYEGTILMATHDQELIDDVATGIYHVENGRLAMLKDPVWPATTSRLSARLGQYNKRPRQMRALPGRLFFYRPNCYLPRRAAARLHGAYCGTRWALDPAPLRHCPPAAPGVAPEFVPVLLALRYCSKILAAQARSRPFFLSVGGLITASSPCLLGD
jgi:hypothetical protein